MLKYIIIAAVVVILLIVISFISSKKKIERIMLSVNEAITNIDVLLKKKLELLKTLEGLVKAKIDIDDLNIDLEKLEKEELTAFQLNDRLKDIHNDLFKAIDMNKKVNKNKKIIDCLNELNDNEEDLFGVLKFYNDSVVEYNRIISSFGSRVPALLLRFRKLEFFSNEKREIFEILKNK